MAKHKQKNNTKQPKSIKSFFNIIKKHKLLTFLIILLFIPVVNFFYVRYENWDNAQMIKGLAKDFPQLVQDIEKATGLELEIKSDCSTTTEKFNNGVKTCEISIAKVTDEAKLNNAVSVVTSSKLISSSKLAESNMGYRIYYRNKYSCSLSKGPTIYLSCITAVKDANKKLAIEEFSRATSSN
ncbi:hypothetical protein KC960_04930 [Candidatus Saccharibacteria bacterium]|nr:hypothetical protein [Candidatus Saccharibacteria bacterium]